MKYTKATAETIEFNSSDILAGATISINALGWHIGINSWGPGADVDVNYTGSTDFNVDVNTDHPTPRW